MMALLGVNNGNNADAVLQFESWLGRKVDLISQFLGEENWGQFDGHVDWALGLYRNLPRAITWSVPLLVKGATLREASAGAYNRHYTHVAQRIAAGRADPIIYIRTAWEFNGNWMKWAS